MQSGDKSQKIMELVDGERVLALEQASLRIPSHSFEEQKLADHYANYMSDMGCDIQMMEVHHPTEQDKTTRQPVGRLAGTGGGPTLMINGHMDTIPIMSGWTMDPYGGKFEDGWIWGVGAHDDKGGLAAAICGVEAIVRSGEKLKGDVLLCPVACHKAGGLGTGALLKNDLQADFCINVEHSANTIATSCVGRVWIKITTRSPGLFFRYSAEAKAAYFNVIEQQTEIIRRLGRSVEPAAADGWLTYSSDPDLPGFPMHCINSIHKENYQRECEMLMEIRTVPGQTLQQMRSDLVRLLEGVKAEHPTLDYEIAIPAAGPEDITYRTPMRIAKDHPLVVALAEGQRLASKREPILGGALRLGNIGDGNILAEAGIPSLQYGPGDIRIYPEWPAADERVELRELIEASRAMAYATHKVCG